MLEASQTLRDLFAVMRGDAVRRSSTLARSMTECLSQTPAGVTVCTVDAKNNVLESSAPTTEPTRRSVLVPSARSSHFTRAHAFDVTPHSLVGSSTLIQSASTSLQWRDLFDLLVRWRQVTPRSRIALRLDSPPTRRPACRALGSRLLGRQAHAGAICRGLWLAHARASSLRPVVVSIVRALTRRLVLQMVTKQTHVVRRWSLSSSAMCASSTRILP